MATAPKTSTADKRIKSKFVDGLKMEPVTKPGSFEDFFATKPKTPAADKKAKTKKE
jgi:hypothetical protein